MDTTQICEALIRHMEIEGCEMFEKNYIRNGEIHATVLGIIGPNAEELTGLIREWAMAKELKRHT